MGVHSQKQRGVHIGVHSLKRMGPHGSAFVSDRDPMGVHSIFVIWITWECTPNANLIKECTPIWSLLKKSSALPFGLYQKRMHSHVIPFASKNAFRYGPCCFWECTPIWSVTIFGVHGPPADRNGSLGPRGPNFRSVDLWWRVYTGRQLRSAFLKVMRTKWECTPKIVTDQIGV